jgi:hypothetical protein
MCLVAWCGVRMCEWRALLSRCLRPRYRACAFAPVTGLRDFLRVSGSSERVQLRATIRSTCLCAGCVNPRCLPGLPFPRATPSPHPQSAGARGTLLQLYSVIRVSLFEPAGVLHPMCISGVGPFASEQGQFKVGYASRAQAHPHAHWRDWHRNTTAQL